MKLQQQQQAKDRNLAEQASFPRKNQALSAMWRRVNFEKGNNKFSGKKRVF